MFLRLGGHWIPVNVKKGLCFAVCKAESCISTVILECPSVAGLSAGTDVVSMFRLEALSMLRYQDRRSLLMRSRCENAAPSL